MSRTKWTIESVREVYRSYGCELLDTEYKTKKTKYTFKCACGNEHTNTFDDFYNGKRQCKECRYNQASRSSRRIKKDNIIESLNVVGGTLKSYEYRETTSSGLRIFVTYTCTENHLNVVMYDSLRKGVGCRQCSIESNRESLRKPIDEVKKELESYNLRLISKTYVNINTPIEYLCTCGDTHKGTLGSIRKGIRGGCQRLWGESNPRWNPNLTQEEREHLRNYPEYHEWVQKVFSRDDYTCRKCSERGGTLNAHHILSYKDYEELRVNVDNGITLCLSCHQQFHKRYGYTRFTKEDLEEFIK
jgi:HNH endonuclease